MTLRFEVGVAVPLVLLPPPLPLKTGFFPLFLRGLSEVPLLPLLRDDVLVPLLLELVLLE